MAPAAITKLTRSLACQSEARAGGSGASTLTNYDGAGRLDNLTHNLASTPDDVTLHFTYSTASQAVARASTNDAYAFHPTILTRDYVANGLNQYASESGTAFTYDARGNFTSDGTRSYTYDLENHLLTASYPTPVALTYDPLGRLQTSTAAGTTTTFLYDGDDLVGEYDASGNILNRYVPGPGVDEPLAWYAGPGVATRHWYQADNQGSIMAWSNAAGALEATRAYDPYGQPDHWLGSRFAYTGQIAIPEAKLYHYKSRAYDPTLGRFLQTDPIGYASDLNSYAYAGNDPIDGSDPSGLENPDQQPRTFCDYWCGTAGWSLDFDSSFDLPLDAPGASCYEGTAGCGSTPTDFPTITVTASRSLTEQARIYVNQVLDSLSRGFASTEGGGAGGGPQSPKPCSQGPARQYGVSISANGFLIIGGLSGSLTLGVSVPSNGVGAQAFLAGEVDPIIGLGVNAGTGIGPTWGHSPSAMAAGFSGNAIGGRAEGGAGLAYGASFGRSTLPDGTVSNSVGLAGPPLPALKVGAYAGNGPAFSGQIATSQVGCRR